MLKSFQKFSFPLWKSAGVWEILVSSRDVLLHCATLGRSTGRLRTGGNNLRKALTSYANYACPCYTLSTTMLCLFDTIRPDIIDPNIQKQHWKVHLLYFCWGVNGSHMCCWTEVECWGTLSWTFMTTKTQTASLKHLYQSYCYCSFYKVRGINCNHGAHRGFTEIWMSVL